MYMVWILKTFIMMDDQEKSEQDDPKSEVEDAIDDRKKIRRECQSHSDKCQLCKYACKMTLFWSLGATQDAGDPDDT